MGSITPSSPPLPATDSPTLHLTTMTPAEHLAQTRANSSEWRGALTDEAYLRREARLADQDLTRGGRLQAWALVDQPNGVETRRVLAGCETYRKKAVVARDARVEEGVVFGVGSVFCPPDMRGKGYAGRMMRELGQRLKGMEAKNEGKTLCSVLFSDIGKKFYARHGGWEPFASTHISLPPAADEGSASGLPEVRLLQAEDLPALCERDEQLLRQRLAKQQQQGQPAMALIPDIATIRWHHAREEFVGTELFGKAPAVKGAMVGTTEGNRVWCYWNRMFSDPAKDPAVLHILRLVVEGEDGDFADEAKAASPAKTRAIAAVMAAAQRQAREWGMAEVMLWNPSAPAVAGAGMLTPKKVEVVQREEESIASLLWFGEGEGAGQGVKWVCNEKYGWC